MSKRRLGTAIPGVRATKQRAAVAELMGQLSEFRSAQEIHEELRRRGDGIGLTTVYRTLQALADVGEIDTIRTDTGEALYRQCSAHHHHHLVCRHCGRTVEVEGPAVEKWADRVAAEHGFSSVSHTVEISGTCDDCAEADTVTRPGTESDVESDGEAEDVTPSATGAEVDGRTGPDRIDPDAAPDATRAVGGGRTGRAASTVSA